MVGDGWGADKRQCMGNDLGARGGPAHPLDREEKAGRFDASPACREARQWLASIDCGQHGKWSTQNRRTRISQTIGSDRLRSGGIPEAGLLGKGISRARTNSRIHWFCTSFFGLNSSDQLTGFGCSLSVKPLTRQSRPANQE